MTRKLAVVGGDGIGPEVVEAALEAAEPLLDGFELVRAEMGWGCHRRCGEALPFETLEAVREAGLALLGAVQTPPRRLYPSPVIGLRRELDLYAGLRPVRDLRGGAVDLVVVRENLEGLYSGIEEGDGDRATALRVVTRRNSERVSRFALAQARLRPEGRRLVTCAHKANVLPLTCGLFRDSFRRVALDFPDVPVEEEHVDACAARMASRPESVHVVVTTNLFGDILSDLAAGLAGGLGLAPSGNVGPDCAVFEPVHGSAPDIAGKGLANPAAAILSLSMLLGHAGEGRSSAALSSAVEAAVRAGEATPDLGGPLSTAQAAAAVRRRVERSLEEG